MKEYKTVDASYKEIESKTCDKCGKKAVRGDGNSLQHMIEWQEFISIGFTGGYGSVFGDGDSYECDLCQSCVKELIGKYIRTVERDVHYGTPTPKL